jgi:hypothetical protein
VILLKIQVFGHVKTCRPALELLDPKDEGVTFVKTSVNIHQSVGSDVSKRLGFSLNFLFM